MLQGVSDMTSHRNYRGNTGSVDDEITRLNLSESFPMSTIITGVTTTTENKVNRTFYFENAETETADIPTKSGLLKYLLIGVGVLAGAGALAAGGYCYYMAGRTSADGRSENRLEPTTPAGRYLRELDWSSSIMASDDPTAGVNSTLIPEISLSPYAYYQSTVARNRTQSLTPVIMSVKPATTPEKLVMTIRCARSAYMKMTSTPAPEISGEEVKVYNHDRIRNIHYRTLMGDYEYPQPLGPIFHDRISSFATQKKLRILLSKPTPVMQN